MALVHGCTCPEHDPRPSARRACRFGPHGRADRELELIGVLGRPDRAGSDHPLAPPTLLRDQPGPFARFVARPRATDERAAWVDQTTPEDT